MIGFDHIYTSYSQSKTKKSSMKKKAFKPSDYIKKHPHNKDVVKKLKTEILNHIKSSFDDPKKVKLSHWYIGVSKDPENDRTNSHKTTKKIKELKNFKSLFARSLSNARKTEEDLCDKFELKNCKVIGGLKKESNKVYIYNLSLIHISEPTRPY